MEKGTVEVQIGPRVILVWVRHAQLWPCVRVLRIHIDLMMDQDEPGHDTIILRIADEVVYSVWHNVRGACSKTNAD